MNKGFGPSYLKRGFTYVRDIHGHETMASALGYHISGDDIGWAFGYYGKKKWNAIPERPFLLRCLK